MAYNYTYATPSPLSLLFTRGLKLKHPCKFFVCRIPSILSILLLKGASLSLSPSEGIRIVESFDQSSMERYEGNKVGMRIEYPFYSHTSEKSLHRTPPLAQAYTFLFHKGRKVRPFPICMEGGVESGARSGSSCRRNASKREVDPCADVKKWGLIVHL